jgi:2',3'-cyclic-nucleotide 2'-phosphodiesterase (5'-nucleotidase family)
LELLKKPDRGGIVAVTRRDFVSGLCAGAASFGFQGPRAAYATQGGGKRLTLLHITDTHAQLETHWEYMPDATPQIVPMGGFARLKTAIDAARATSNGSVFFG